MSHLPEPISPSSIAPQAVVGIVSVQKRSALGTSRRELSEDMSAFGIGAFLGWRAIELGKQPQGYTSMCCVHTYVPGTYVPWYTTLHPILSPYC